MADGLDKISRVPIKVDRHQLENNFPANWHITQDTPTVSIH